MQKTLVVVFEDEAKARRASRALEMLEARGDLSLDELVVIVKNPDGSVRTTKMGTSESVTRALAASLAGGLFGVSGGSVGVADGLIGGAVIGAISHKKRSVDDELDKDIGDALPASKAAVIAEVLEESEHSVDARMAALGGIVFRWTSGQIRTGSEEPKIQRTNAKVDRGRFDPKIDELRVKIQEAIESRMAKTEARKQQRERWIHLIEEEAAQARTKRKEQSARIKELQT